MDYSGLKQLIVDMKIGERKTIYKINENTDIFVNKPIKVPPQLKNSKKYNPKKNFQIGLKKRECKEFLPNHLRIMIDLQLKKEDNPLDSELLFDAIEDIYEGKDPENYRHKFLNLKFNREMENSFTDLCLAQLFMLEQDINYDFGKVKPPRAYLMGYIRMIRLSVDEIDKLLWGSTRHPPKVEYRSKNCLNQKRLN